MFNHIYLDIFHCYHHPYFAKVTTYLHNIHLQRSQRGDGLLLAVLIDLAPLLGRLAVPVVVVPRRRPVLRAWVLVVGTRGPARSALHRGSRSVLVLLFRACKEVDISGGNWTPELDIPKSVQVSSNDGFEKLKYWLQ